MDFAKLHTKLIAAARSNPPSDHVPYAFEKRMLARLGAVQMDDSWAVWGKALWRGAFACLVVAVGLSVWSLQATGEVDHDFDAAMVSAAEQVVESW